VCNGGANNAYNNNSKKALVQFVKFLQNNNNTNVIVTDIPHRYDLPDNSHINEEIKSFNSKLKKIAKLYNHVMVLESSFRRNCFTHH
jgi:GTPase SAR1 family protein